MSMLPTSLRSALYGVLHRLTQLMELRGRARWLLLAIIVVLVIGVSYAIVHLASRIEWVEQYGAAGAFLVSFVASTTILFPAPGFAVVWAIIGTTPNWPMVALSAGFGGGLGEFTAYVVGYAGAVVIPHQHLRWYRRAEDWMRRYGDLAILVFSLTWLPFDLVGIAAGALRFPFWRFLLASVAGRIPRSFLECYLARKGWDLWPSFRDSLSGVPWWGWTIIGVGILAAIAGTVVLIRRRHHTASHAENTGQEE